MKIKNYLFLLLAFLFCFSLLALKGSGRRSFLKSKQEMRQFRPSMRIQPLAQKFKLPTINKPNLPATQAIMPQKFTGRQFIKGHIDIKPRQIGLHKKVQPVKTDHRVTIPSLPVVQKPRIQISPRVLGRSRIGLPRIGKTDFKEFAHVKKDIDKKFVRRNIPPNYHIQLKKAISDIKLTGKLDPIRLAHLKGKQAHKFAKFRTPHRLYLQKQFLHKHVYKGKPWIWWWKHKPYYFLVYFPLFFRNIYGYYPPIYYDFYITYGYTPIDQCFEECTRECIRECLNSTDLSLEDCQAQCTEVCSNNCGIII